jgi:hypothetical protein
MQTARPPAYVEHWDSVLDFPGIDARSSSLDAPMLHQPVVLKRIAEPKAPEFFEFEVLAGFHRVAAALVESEIAHNKWLVDQDVAGWIAEEEAAERSDRDWHRRWADHLAENTAIRAALAKGGPNELFAQAGLTYRETLAMRLKLTGKTRSEIGVALNITSSAVGDRLEEAFARIREYGNAKRTPTGH